MASTFLRFGIATLVAAWAALSGSEARGGWWSHACGACNTRCAASACGRGLSSVPWTPSPRPAFGYPAHAALRPAVLPPPGTLGMTYRQLSWPVPDEKHPRAGMLEVYGVPPHLLATVNGMKGYRGGDGVWYFETARPLIPCVPFIKTVRVHPPHTDPQRCADFRVLRLIPGRVVFLRY